MARNTTEDIFTVGDVIAVFIRYRKLIIIPTILVVLAFLIILFISQTSLSFFIQPSGSVYTVTGNFISLSDDVRFELLLSMEQEITEKLQSLQFMSTVVGNLSKESSFFATIFRNKDQQINTDLISRLQQNITYRFKNNILIIEFISLPNFDSENSEIFLMMLLNQLEQEIIEHIDMQYKLFVTRNNIITSRLLQYLENVPSRSDDELFLRRIVSGENINNFFTSITSIWARPPLILLKEEFSLVVYTGKTLAIITAVCIFVFSVLSFILNYIRRLKQNKSEMNKISEAWKNQQPNNK